jgi:hypothetical protein
MKRSFKQWRGLLFSLLLVSVIISIASCGSDEPQSNVIDYYLNVEEEFLIDGSTAHTDRYYSPITRMRDVIRKTYPNPDNKGLDEAVIAACDKEYETYCEMYNGGSEHFTCLFHLVKAHKVDGIVKESETLRTYNYDINPYEINSDE